MSDQQQHVHNPRTGWVWLGQGEGDPALGVTAKVGLAKGWVKSWSVPGFFHPQAGWRHREAPTDLATLVREYPDRRQALIDAHRALIWAGEHAIDRAQRRVVERQAELEAVEPETQEKAPRPPGER